MAARRKSMFHDIKKYRPDHPDRMKMSSGIGLEPGVSGEYARLTSSYPL
jgi:hypothetical protein